MIVELDHRLFLEQDYGLINPLQVGKEHYADLEVHRLMPKGFARHERMLPLLVPLGSLEREQRIELLERTEEWARNHHMPFFSALFTSQHEAGYVRAMLVDRMVSRRPDQVSVWLRFHDPRVFRHLQWLLDPKQVPALMGPAVTWLGFDPLCRHWHCWSRPDSPGNQRLCLSQEQWQVVEQFEALNRCLRDLAQLDLRPTMMPPGAYWKACWKRAVTAWNRMPRPSGLHFTARQAKPNVKQILKFAGCGQQHCITKF